MGKQRLFPIAPTSRRFCRLSQSSSSWSSFTPHPSHPILHTPSFTTPILHTPSFTHTVIHTQSFTRHPSQSIVHTPSLTAQSHSSHPSSTCCRFCFPVSGPFLSASPCIPLTASYPTRATHLIPPDPFCGLTLCECCGLRSTPTPRPQRRSSLEWCRIPIAAWSSASAPSERG